MLFLFASLVSAEQVTLAWDDPNNDPAVNRVYRIYYWQPAWLSPESIDVGVQTTYELSGLEAGQTYTFAVTAHDGQGGRESAWSNQVSKTFAPVNHAPVAMADQATTLEDKAVTINVLGNDTDPDGDTLTVSALGAPTSGTATTNSTSVTYTPKANFAGTDTFSYTVKDTHGATGQATVTVTVTAVNDVPVAMADQATTLEDKAVTINVLSNDTDADGNTLTVSAVGFPASGTVTTNGTSITYTPKANFAGSDTFSYTVKDTHGATGQASVTVTVTAVNDVPVAMADQATTSKATAVTINVLSNDTDADGNTLTVSAAGFPASGTATTNGTSITYTPHADFAGSDTFSYTVKDTQGATDQGTVTITVTADNEVFPIEIGEVHVDHTWTRVNFQKTYVNPIVIANPLSYNDHDPAVVRIKNVDTTGFNIRVQEWDYLDDIHGTETVGYMVMERGRYTLSDGTIVDASSFKANDTGTFHAIPFSQPFQSAPVVLTSVTSFNQNIAKVMRLRNVDTQAFQYQLQRQERRKRDRSRSNRDIAETITYIAWEASAGTLNDLDFVVSKTQDVITHNFQTILYPTVFIDLPVFLADMQTTDSADTANIRWDRKDFYGVDIQIDEEQSYDQETNHTTEVVGYILLAHNDTSLDTDGDQLTNIDEITLYDTDPAAADTDADGSDDGDEVTFWGDAWQQDTDNDGLINLLDPDADNDGAPDGSEIRDGFDPADPNSRP